MFNVEAEKTARELRIIREDAFAEANQLDPDDLIDDDGDGDGDGGGGGGGGGDQMDVQGAQKDDDYVDEETDKPNLAQNGRTRRKITVNSRLAGYVRWRADDA